MQKLSLLLLFFYSQSYGMFPRSLINISKSLTDQSQSSFQSKRFHFPLCRNIFTIKKTKQTFDYSQEIYWPNEILSKIFLLTDKVHNDSKKKEIYLTFLKLHEYITQEGFIIPFIMRTGESSNYIVPFNENIDHTSGAIVITIVLFNKVKPFINIAKSLQYITIYLQEIRKLYIQVLKAKTIATELGLKVDVHGCDGALAHLQDMLNIAEGLRKELFNEFHDIKNA